ncbi:MAG: hypothetical protein PF572_02450 [Patescibacteria group bacterium]|jgi:hypothetical protein|nr:hypothetical protein [Patescibacteria group bacterium]
MKFLNLKSIAILSFLILILLISLYLVFKNDEENIVYEQVETPQREKIISTNPNDVKRETFTPVVLGFEDCIDLVGEEKEECLNQVNYNVAYLNDDISYCLEINNYDKRSECIYGLVRELYSVNSCKRIPNHSRSMSCIQDSSIATRYTDFCEIFEGEPYEKQECLDRTNAFVIPERYEINECSSIETLEYKNLCFQNFYDACDDLKDRGDREDCNSARDYYLISIKEDCQKLLSSKYQRVCFEKFKPENINKKVTELDIDGDGLWDEKELWMNTDPFNPDTDGDGLSDYEEIIEKKGGNPLDADTDQDGLSDYDEIQLGTSVQRPDSDGDGILDSADSDPLSGDSDNDRLTDAEEILWGTDPNNRDTDGDGLSDYNEIKNGKNPLGEGWKSDTDGDGLIDVDEIFYLTNATKKDTDGDGVNDRDEIEAGTNPLGPGDFDFDGDRLSDKEEIELGTNIYKSDTNGDDVTDYESIKKGLDPISKDTDGDGLNNLYEIKNDLDPIKSDTDGDGLSDGDEINKYFTNPKDLDTDNDGFLDGEEVQAGFDPRTASGV